MPFLNLAPAKALTQSVTKPSTADDHAPPGKTFLEMLLLTLQHQRLPNQPFSPRLLLAIFWEESPFFTNQKQQKGTALGFGQVEPSQFFVLKTPAAKQKGYFVPGLSSSMKFLPDPLSVTVPSCMLLHLFHHASVLGTDQKIDAALRGYGGVGSGLGIPDTKRLKIIEGWKTCARELESVPLSLFHIVNFPQPIRVLEDRILAALRHAKSFQPEAKVVPRDGGTPRRFRDLLFPKYWFFPEADQARVATFLPAGQFLKPGSAGEPVRFLQRLLNGQPDLPIHASLLATDGLFGPKTLERVRGFQADHALAVDGVVGPKTVAALA